MANWREYILKEFTPQVARLTLVADPDGLLLEEGIYQGITERGFELIPFEDHVSFRFAYESKYRSHWDRGEMTELVVVLRAHSQDLNYLPYDLLQAGRKLYFALGDLFPNLSPPVVSALQKNDLDALYQAQSTYNPERLGDNATKDFILRHVFEIAPEQIRQPSDLLRVLLRLHYRKRHIPGILNDRFIHILRQNRNFEDWPLERIVPDRDDFYAFLQERWPIFVNHIAITQEDFVHEPDTAYNLKFPGPSDIPFDHDDVRIYIDNLFIDGILQPVTYKETKVLANKWVAVGIHLDPKADRMRRLDGLLKTIEDSIPVSDARHQEWLAMSQRWAELLVLWHDADMPKKLDMEQRFRGIRDDLDRAFLSWVSKRYSGLHNQPAIPPVMVHHVPRYLARSLESLNSAKVALVVVDGLALDQWLLLREELAQQRDNLTIREEAVFAWLPTTTSVSRQALFAGKPPIYFPASINTTDREGYLWSQFWLDHGMNPAEVVYGRGLGEEPSIRQITETLGHPKVRVAGLVVDKVDRIMHGMELGTSGIHNQVRQWAREGFMARFLDVLLDLGFSVYLTSDHGNIEAEGIGRPSEGAIADQRGERVRIYSDAALRKRVKCDFPDAIEWPAIGLPEDYLPLFAPGRTAFIREGDRLVGHGGISLEELIVPFVHIERR